MTEMAPQKISKSVFSILFEKLIEKCYFDQLEEVYSIPDYKLYGYENAKNSTDSITAKVAVIGKISGRSLRNIVKEYEDQSIFDLEIPLNYLSILLEYIGFESIEDLTQSYFEEKGITKSQYTAPQSLKYRSKEAQKFARPNIQRIDERLEALANTNWWAYTRHDSIKSNKPIILRRGFQITNVTTSGDYEVKLWNQQPYSIFNGKISRKYSGDNLLDCELISTRRPARKRMYILFHINFNLENNKSLFLGIYLTHSDNAAVRASTIVIEKIDVPIEEATLRTPVSFDFDSGSLNENIKQYLYGKKLNQIKLPRGIFHHNDLQNWLTQKQVLKPKYDLFISTPFRGLYNHHKKSEGLKSELYQLIANRPTNGTKTSNIRSELSALVDKYFWSKEESVAYLSEFETLQREVISIIRIIKESKDINYNSFWYPPNDGGLHPNKKTDAGNLLKRQFQDFRMSKAFLFIFPQPVSSSVLCQLGWAMMATVDTNKPILVAYSNKSDLPFLIKKIDTLYNPKVFMTSLSEIGGIQGIPGWIKDNKFDQIIG